MQRDTVQSRDAIEIDPLVLGPIATNCYLVSRCGSGEAVVIDPGAEAQKIIARLRERKKTPAAILLTHGHFDHVGAVDALKETYHISAYAHETEIALAANPNINGGTLHGIPNATRVDTGVHEGDVLTLAGIAFRVIHTPGHTAGGVCYYMEEANALFSGDTLFAQSVGRTDFPTGSMEALLHSVRKKLLTLPDAVRVFPGHGPATTIGTEKQYNPYA